MEIVNKWRGRSLDDVAAFAREASPLELCRSLHFLCGEHSATFTHSLDLVASHGLLSPQARAMMSTGLVSKFCPPGFTNFPGDRDHTGSFWIDQVETVAMELAKRLFKVRYVELRPQSGAVANEVTIAALCSRRDTIMAQSRFHGGHPSTRESSYGGLMDLNYVDIPFNEQDHAIDLDKAEATISQTKPELVVIGSAFIRFPYPVRELKRMAERVGSRILYDGAHALGLMAGSQYQNPITEGADVVTGSTQKTLCGPIGGIIITNSGEVARAVRDATNRFVCSYLNYSIGALAVTFAEMLHFGLEYARNVVRNAQALASALNEQGFTVLGKEQGFTQTHIILFDLKTDAEEAVRRLETAGIFATRKSSGRAPSCTGIRLGTTSVTRRGMGTREMNEIATFIRRILIDGEKPTQVAKNVADLAHAFNRVQYCFD